MNFSGRYRLAAAVLDGDAIPLTRVKRDAPRRIIALDGKTSVRHCAGPRPVAIVDRGDEVLTVLSGGREMTWPRWMATMASHRRSP